MKYPIGIQTFEQIIMDGYIYVDKTDLIYSLVTRGKIYFLSRPRRFGKSLLLSTLENYFQRGVEFFRDGEAVEPDGRMKELEREAVYYYQHASGWRTSLKE